LKARTFESSRRGTKAHESRPPWQQEGPPPTWPSRGQVRAPGLARVSNGAADPETGGQAARREERSCHPTSRGVGAGQRFKSSVFEVQRSTAPSGEGTAKGREARGAAARGHGQDAPFKRSKGRGRGWRLAHRSALEALGELGRCLTVIRRFYRPSVSTDPGFAYPGVGVRIAECNRDGWTPGGARGTGPRVPRVRLRE